MTEEQQQGYEKTCPYCGKKFSSLSRRQIEFNYFSHIGSCKNNAKNNEVKDAQQTN